MNYSAQGAHALAEMSPFGRPSTNARNRAENDRSGWGRATYPMSVGGVQDDGHLQNRSGWQPATYAMVAPQNMQIGFDPGSFLSENKVACAIAAAVIAGGAAYYFGYR